MLQLEPEEESPGLTLTVDQNVSLFPVFSLARPEECSRFLI